MNTNNKLDECSLCLQKVQPDKWCEHMDKVHHAVNRIKTKIETEFDNDYNRIE